MCDSSTSASQAVVDIDLHHKVLRTLNPVDFRVMCVEEFVELVP